VARPAAASWGHWGAMRLRKRTAHCCAPAFSPSNIDCALGARGDFLEANIGRRHGREDGVCIRCFNPAVTVKFFANWIRTLVPSINLDTWNNLSAIPDQEPAALHFERHSEM
jgi:hypothetical protein